MDGRESGETTVAFELAALEAVHRPVAVFEQTRGWARSVGIVSDRPTHVITHFAREHGLDYGFTSGPRALLESLVAIRAQPEHRADRYLLIAGTDVDSGEVAARGWAVLSLPEAAEAAGWDLESPEDEAIESRGTRDGWP